MISIAFIEETVQMYNNGITSILSDTVQCWSGFFYFFNTYKYNDNDLYKLFKEIDVWRFTSKDFIQLCILKKLHKFLLSKTVLDIKRFYKDFEINTFSITKNEYIFNILLKWIKLNNIPEEIFLEIKVFNLGNIIKDIQIHFLIQNKDRQQIPLNVEQINNKFICIVCISNVVCMIGKECKHLSCCLECSSQLNNKCPICRNPYGFEKIYTN